MPFLPGKLKFLSPPPPLAGAYPRHFTVHFAREVGNLNAALEGWGI